MTITAKEFRDRRRQAYRAIFESVQPANWRVKFLAWLASWILPKDTVFETVFRGMLVNIVLADLRRFCKATRPTFVVGDSHASALLEGRREVWNRINAYLHLEERQIYGLNEENHE